MDAYLLLENGTVFTGKAFGAQKETVAELVFNTQVVGYLEILTDPAYMGQAVVQTFPLAGNYGVISEDFESDYFTPAAYIVRSVCDAPSNFRCEGKLNDLLIEKKIPGIYGIDTRKLTKILRNEGTMNGLLTYEAPGANKDELLKKIKAHKALCPIEKITVKETKAYTRPKNSKSVVLYDFGVKNSIIENMLAQGVNITRVPAGTSAKDALALKPDGIVLSDGPGNPEDLASYIEEIKALADSGIAVFAMGLGHQLLALAKGAKIEKLPFGHHGANQPVKNTDNGKTYITAQGHNYTVSADGLPKDATVFMHNANDKSVEAIRYGKNVLSCQFQPEFDKSELNTSFLFEQFKNEIC
ncbi:MAG: carbamoyl phosphate synthase small subunit [Clostridia bacterium]|nr:carbamoyl phosphate synthase small subunit [Clostridia bacterium]